jgi:hypothetical protein
MGRQVEALESLERALALRPDHADALNNRGNTLDALDRLEEALASFDQAVLLKPGYAEAWNNRGNTLRRLNRLSDALASADRAVALSPDYADAHWNRGLTLLLGGDLVPGWAEYEWRFTIPSLGHQPRPFTHGSTRWRGEQDLAGKTILVYAEQGLGDTIQFCRYTSLLAARGARVVLEVQRPLRNLLAGLTGVEDLLTVGEQLPAFDLYCPLLSLPMAFKTDISTIPAPHRYLAADSAGVQLWRGRLAGFRNESISRRVGLVWAGNPNLGQDRHRSIPLESLLCISRPGVQFCSLQKELRAGDREILAEHPEVLHFGDELGDFSDTAALIENLDLVISVDTAVAHLAGALGKPVWILHRVSPDFRWLLGREDSPWYPSARLFRQTRSGEWADVVDELSSALQQVCSGPGEVNAR